MSDSKFIQVALEAVQQAEVVIKKYYSTEIRATLKQDQSPVTIADQEAEQIIRQLITKNFPQHQILGEEGGKTKNDSDFLWIIDPIDGTKNYIRQIPLFATQLALMKEGEIILGVSNAPAVNELMYAEKGKGAYLNTKKVQVSQIDQLNQAYLSFGGIGYFKRQGLINNLLTIENLTRAHRGIGDFWSYHLLAQGKIDIMLEGETKIWDIAAVSIIVNEAGGQVTDIQGNSINHQTTSVIATNRHLHNQVSSFFLD